MPRRKVEIDFNHEWTINDYAKKKGLSKGTVATWVKRGLIEYRQIPELNGLILVKLNSEKPRPYKSKK